MKIGDRNKKIGILTFHRKSNYGAVLQAFALYTAIKRLGFEPIILNRSSHFFDKVKDFGVVGAARNTVSLWIRDLLFAREFSRFRRCMLPNTTSFLFGTRSLSKASKNLDAVVVGSDQVWRLSYARNLIRSYFLDFVPENVKRISYAASFGIDYFEGDSDCVDQLGKLLKKFDAVSVREDVGTRICMEKFGVRANHVLDPTFLLEEKVYVDLAKDCTTPEQPYIAQFFLDDSNFKREVGSRIKSVTKANGIAILNPKDRFSLRKVFSRGRSYNYPSIETWLSGISNSSFVVTDSFHGVVFSIIFKKQFVCILNDERGNTRIESLLDMLGIRGNTIDKSISKVEDFTPIEIDYKEVWSILDKQREASLVFLKNALNKYL